MDHPAAQDPAAPQSVSPQNTPPHNTPPRTRPLHWAFTALLLAALTAGALAWHPAGRAAAAGRTVRAADLPLKCPAGKRITATATGDFDHDGRRDTAVAARCIAGGGTPPDTLYIYGPVTTSAGRTGRAARPVPTAVLLAADKGLTVRKLRADHDGRIIAELLGYSSVEQPRSNPDLRGTVHWDWTAGAFRPTDALPAGGPARSV